MTQQRKIGPIAHLSFPQRKAMIEEYLQGNCRKQQIWKKYTGQDKEHGHMLRWMRKLGYLPDSVPVKKTSSPIPISVSVEKDSKPPDPAQLQNYIKELRKQLEAAQLRAEGYELMIDLAEKEFNIPIRKKSNTR